MQQLNLDQAMQLAFEHHQAGRFAEAEGFYRRVLQEQPDHPHALHLLGAIAHQAGRYEIAVELIQRAIAKLPDVPEFHYNLGNAHVARKDPAQAIAAFSRAIQLRPDLAAAYNNMGNVFRDLDRLDEAITAYTRANQLKPDYADAQDNLARALDEEKRQNEAANFGNQSVDATNLDEMAAACAAAVRAAPADSQELRNLGNVLRDQGKLDEALACYDRAIARNLDDPISASARLYSIHFHPDYDPARIYEEHRQWNQRHAASLKNFRASHPNSRDPRRRMKIGYMSGDFRAHTVGRFLLPLLASHYSEDVEVFCYSDVRLPDALTDTFRGLADNWRETAAMSDEGVCKMVREDRIDILVDLAMHTPGNRLLVFARKPAPVQMTWLAYCSTTGLDAIDYRLSDPFLDPLMPSSSAPASESPPDMGSMPMPLYSEETIHLPQTCWCYDPGIEAPEPGPPPVLTSGHITFGCLSDFTNASMRARTAWCRLLQAVPHSRLMLHSREGSHRQSLLDLLAREGINPRRATFVGPTPIADRFRTCQQLDIALDLFPFSARTTMCDALWMGVPVVTLAGRTAVGRAGASILSNAGLPELVAHSEAEYVHIATSLAGNFPGLAELRSGLRRRMRQSPLMDAQGFARNVEKAYRQVWGRWCAA